MTIELKHPHAWLADTTELPLFLDLAYSDHYGEIWLFNNDLQVIRGEETFRTLYSERIAGRLGENIDSVKILIRPALAPAFLGPNRDPKLMAKFRQIAKLVGGIKRLSTFYFGVAKGKGVPEQLRTRYEGKNTWVFYTHRGQLDLNSGVVMVRNAQFPFDGPEHRIAQVWLLRDQPVIQDRLKKTFEACFHNPKIFRWMKVESTNPFKFSLVRGESPETKRRRRLREHANAPEPLSLRGRVDVAIVAALSEEMAAIEEVLDCHPRPTPLPHDRYRYVLYQSPKGWRTTVLLVTLNSQGGVPAAAITWDALEEWNPRHVILAGVAGGDPGEKQQRLGDVVVGEMVVGYEVAKLKEHGVGPRPRTYEPDQALRDAAGQALKGWPKLVSRRPDGTRTRVKVHLTVVGSGSKLVARRGFFNGLQKIHEKTHATEMEGDGVGYACDQHPTGAHMLLVKGIMDRSDGTSRSSTVRDHWKAYAARTAAQFVRDVLDAL